MGDIPTLTRAARAALLGISLLSCHPRHGPRQWDTSQREFQLRGPAAIAVVNLPAVNRRADNAWLRVFLDQFDDVADSLERAGYAAGVTFRDTVVVTFRDPLVVPDSANPNARDTIVQRSGFNSVHLVTSGSPITYFFVAPGRKPYSYGGGKPHNGCSPSGARGPRGPRGTRCEGPARRGRRGDAGEVRGKRQGA